MIDLNKPEFQSWKCAAEKLQVENALLKRGLKELRESIRQYIDMTELHHDDNLQNAFSLACEIVEEDTKAYFLIDGKRVPIQTDLERSEAENAKLKELLRRVDCPMYSLESDKVSKCMKSYLELLAEIKQALEGGE